MLFTVHMWWGKPHQQIVYALDKDGELVPQKTMTNGPRDPERRELFCPAKVWDTLIVLGKTHGWQPMGTVPS